MDEFEPAQPRDPNDPTLGASSVPHLPPSSLEIKMRTMATDIESVGKGGGLLGITSRISLSIPQEGTAPRRDVPVAPDVAPKSKTLKYVLLGVGGALVLFALGYFLPILFFGSTEKPGMVGGGAATTTAPEGQPASPAGGQSGRLIHKSFFAIPPDAILPILPVENTSLSMREQWQGAFKFATGTITETQLNNRAGEYLAFSDFLSALNISFSAGSILQSDFEMDFTSFVYKDSAGLWPGLILKLKSGVNALLVGGDVAKFESENNFIDSLFVVSPGAREEAFRDARLSGLPIRELGFAVQPAQFVYGLNSQGYLVIASSRDAFNAALSRL